MNSINYFVNTHGLFVFIINLLVMIFIVCIFAFFSICISKYFKLPEKIEKILMVGFIILGLLVGNLCISNILDQINQGGIKKLFILNKNNTPQLTVWFTRILSKRFGANFDQRLRCYELKSGNALDYIQMSMRYYTDDYRFYWLSGNYAWGFSDRTGIQLLDLVKPEVVAEEKKILELNPELGNSIRFLDEDILLDPMTHGLNVETKDNKIYRIDINLNATEIDRVLLENNSTSTKINIFQQNWIFNNVKGTLGKNLNKKGIKLSKDCAYLLEPEFIEELNFKFQVKNKIWIFHKSAIFDKFDPLISLIDADGKELNRINLFEVFKNKKAKVLATFTQDKEILVFVSIGYTYYAGINGFTLTALRTDPETGKMTGKIKFF